jgi:hypothetical protein
VRKWLTGISTALVGTMLVASSAFATVTFDPTCSLTPSNSQGKCGFVGKGDVQIAFSLNNIQIQNILLANLQAFIFSYDATATYAAVCTFTTGAGTPGEQTHNINIPRHTVVNAQINGSPRSGPTQFTGFLLTGLGTATSNGTVPVVGEACVANEDGVARNGTWSSVTPTGSTGGLYVTYNGNSVLLLPVS